MIRLMTAGTRFWPPATAESSHTPPSAWYCLTTSWIAADSPAETQIWMTSAFGPSAAIAVPRPRAEDSASPATALILCCIFMIGFLHGLWNVLRSGLRGGAFRSIRPCGFLPRRAMRPTGPAEELPAFDPRAWNR